MYAVHTALPAGANNKSLYGKCLEEKSTVQAFLMHVGDLYTHVKCEGEQSGRY